VELEEGRLFTEEMISAAESRWHEAPAFGRLVIGLDPAGDNDPPARCVARTRGVRAGVMRIRRFGARPSRPAPATYALT
jgi:hypothetical protein